ncbi:MAG: hypothetical protein H6709_01760 [Kofleriaceae bacterium]|nr:hypothetical protein [Kofleriaceae bacterium]MCB9570795.1 hypothetical protein [Kofleriaceae bacterium]
MTRPASIAPLATAASIALALAASGCIRLHARPLRVPAPVLDGDRLTIASLDPGAPPMVLEGPWVADGDRQCIAGGTMRLVTATGAIPFDDATLCVTSSPVSIEGDATVALPALGLLAQAGVHAEGRRAHVRFALGSQLGTIDLGGHPLRADPRHYYLSLSYQDGFTASFGKLSLQTPGGAAEVVIDPQEPMVYLAGRLSLPELELEGAFGFSLAGRIGAPTTALPPGAPRLTGHILASATVPVPDLPLTVRGELLIDLDADDDGVTVLDGDDRDFALLASGAVSVGFGHDGFGLALEVGSASLYFDARSGAVALAGETGGVFDGTPLAPLAPNRGELTGHYRGPRDFGLELTGDVRVLGYATEHVRIALDPAGIHAQLRVELPAGLGGVDVHGEAGPRGFALTGRADLTIAGLRLAGAEVTLGTGGVTVRGALALPGLGSIAVAGTVRADGEVALEGRGTLSPFGLELAGAHVAVSTRGAVIDAHVDFLGSRFAVSGSAANGHARLSGEISLDLVVLKGKTVLSIADTGARAMVYGRACVSPAACVDLAGLDVDTSGKVCPIFPVVGRQCIKLL